MIRLTHSIALPLSRLQALLVEVQDKKGSRIREIRETFGETPGSEAAKTAFLVLALVVAAVIVFFFLRRLFAKATAKTDAEMLFLQLCAAHDLSKHDKDLLQEVAAGTDQPHSPTLDPNAPPPEPTTAPPAAMFVRKSLFQQAIAQETSPERKERLQTLFRRLFA